MCGKEMINSENEYYYIEYCYRLYSSRKSQVLKLMNSRLFMGWKILKNMFLIVLLWNGLDSMVLKIWLRESPDHKMNNVVKTIVVRKSIGQ